MSKEKAKQGIIDFVEGLESAVHQSRILLRFIHSLEIDVKQIEYSQEDLTNIVYDLIYISEKLENSLSIVNKEWKEDIRPVFQKGKEVLEVESKKS